MISTEKIQGDRLEELIEDKITMIEGNICGLLDFIEDSVQSGENILVREVVDYLGTQIDNLSIHYIINASNWTNDKDIFLNYISRAAIINPELEIKEKYNFLNPDIGVSIKDEDKGFDAVLSSVMMIQLPRYDLLNQTLNCMKETYKVNPKGVMATIEFGEIKEQIVKEFGYEELENL
jgi:hypothetical protein